MSRNHKMPSRAIRSMPRIGLQRQKRAMVSVGRLALALCLGLLLMLTVVKIASWATPNATTTLRSVNTGQHFLPPYGNARDRFGFDSGPLSGYDVAQLHAGWYSNWGARLYPAHPDQLVYVQLIRFHAGADPNDPGLVTVKPDRATIADIAADHPGSLWLMSNEPDSIWQGDPILPDVYAIVYHDFYEYIRGLDATALIANGGIVQPTPCRLQYLDIVLDTYLATYGEPMPVDVWNTHAFILREVYNSWGASTPPGVDPSCGIDYAVDDGDNTEILMDNIRAMRAWMKAKGYQDTPLVISEYGVLWPVRFAPEFTPARVSHFMTETFDLFLNTTDLEIGYPADDHRLVQAWAWYSLSDDQIYNGHLFESISKTISPMGEAYASYTAGLSDTLFVDLSARLVPTWPSFTPTVTNTGASGSLTFSVYLTGSIGNLGKLSATGALARFETVLDEGGTVVIGHDTVHTVPARFEGLLTLPLSATLAAPARHQLRLSLDPEGWVDEPREWNNVATATLDLRPDLVPLDVAYRLTGPVLQSGTLLLTATIGNQGDWPSTAVSGTATLQRLPDETLVVPQTFSVPPMNIGDQTEVAFTLTWPVPDQDLYRVALELDDGDSLEEQNEENNRYELVISVPVSVTLLPTTTTVLTSISGALQIVFPAGAVTTPTHILYTPLWPQHWDTGVLKTSTTAFSLAKLLNGEPVPLAFSRPVTVTWHYGDTDVSALEERDLRLFVRADGGLWSDAACKPYQRDLDRNRLTASVCETGWFVFGNRYDLFFPLLARSGSLSGLYGELDLPAPEMDRPGSPLRLPRRER